MDSPGIWCSWEVALGMGGDSLGTLLILIISLCQMVMPAFREKYQEEFGWERWHHEQRLEVGPHSGLQGRTI